LRKSNQRKKTTRNFQESRRKVDTLKSSFITLSHEIKRTPNAIMGFTSLHDTNLEEKEKLEYFQENYKK
jgi:hypothetical protein